MRRFLLFLLFASCFDIADMHAQPIDSSRPATAITQPATTPANVERQARNDRPVMAVTATTAVRSGMSWWCILALLMAAGALAKSFLPNLLQDKSSKKRGIDSGSPAGGERSLRDGRIAALESRLMKMEMDMKSLQGAIQDAQSEFNKKLRALGGIAIPVSTPAAAAKKTPAPSASAIRVKYAKTADSSGFDADTLSDEADNKKIFEIKLNGNNRQATYRVTTNREAQLFALSNMNVYLGDACDYSTAPNSINSSITTTKPGRLELEGNKWKIVSKAQISFS